MRLVPPLSIALAATPAVADELSQYKPEARPHVQAAAAAFLAKDFEASGRSWERAYAADPNPQLLYSLAQAERFGGHCDRAIIHYGQYLTHELNDTQLATTRGAIALCVAELMKAPNAAAKPIQIGPSELPWYKSPVTGAILVGTIGVTVGIGFMIAAGGAKDRARSADNLDDFQVALDDATLRTRIGVTTLILGSALGIGAVVYHYKYRVEPIATPTAGGVALSGRF